MYLIIVYIDNWKVFQFYMNHRNKPAVLILKCISPKRSICITQYKKITRNRLEQERNLLKKEEGKWICEELVRGGHVKSNRKNLFKVMILNLSSVINLRTLNNLRKGSNSIFMAK